MNADKLSVEELMEYYKPDVDALIIYLPWLEAQKGKVASSIYKGDNLDAHSISFPVYDSTLLGFVKEAQKSSLILRNYFYVYSQNKMRTVNDELSFIRQATIHNMGDLWGIMSKYILEGMTKGNVWSEGVKNGIFLELVTKMKEIIDFWGKEGIQ